jgi:HEAT repeat protein
MGIMLTFGWCGLAFTLVSGAHEQRQIHLKADRPLSATEATQMVQAIVTLLDKSQRVDKRREAAVFLGQKIAHQAAILPLKMVAMDEKDNSTVRYWAVTALSQIADKTVVEILIKLCSSGTTNIRRRAHEQLLKLSGCIPKGIPSRALLPNATQQDIDALVKAWREWWEQNREKFKFDRAKTLIERF